MLIMLTMAPALGRARGLRHLVGLEPVELALLRQNQQVLVRRGHEQVLDPVLVLGAHGGDALAAAALGAVGVQRAGA
jgi:hypothetical protein